MSSVPLSVAISVLQAAGFLCEALHSNRLNIDGVWRRESVTMVVSGVLCNRINRVERSAERSIRGKFKYFLAKSAVLLLQSYDF